MDVGPLYPHADAGYESSIDSSDVEDDDDSSSNSSDDVNRPPLYTKETQFQVINWRPALWWIPSQQDLDEVAKFLSPEPDGSIYDATGRGRELRPRYCLSAAATAIQYLGCLTPQNRMHLRKVTRQEDHTNGGLPQTHARGLVPFYVENPQLQVERRVDI